MPIISRAAVASAIVASAALTLLAIAAAYVGAQADVSPGHQRAFLIYGLLSAAAPAATAIYCICAAAGFNSPRSWYTILTVAVVFLCWGGIKWLLIRSALPPSDSVLIAAWAVLTIPGLIVLSPQARRSNG